MDYNSLTDPNHLLLDAHAQIKAHGLYNITE